jgi:predicted nucleic acid-binding Zn ribbon protein
VPVYVFRCPLCGRENELLLRLGDTAPRPCETEACPGSATQRFTRVAVKYESFGFTHTDNLVADADRKSFRDLKQRAEEISDS